MDGARPLTGHHFGTQTFCGASATLTHVLPRPGQSMSSSQVCVHMPSVPPVRKMQKSLLHSALSLHWAPNSFFSGPPLDELEELELVPLDDPPLVDPPLVDPPLVDPPLVDPPLVDPPLVDPPLDDPSSLSLHAARTAHAVATITPSTLRITVISRKGRGVHRRREEDAARRRA